MPLIRVKLLMHEYFHVVVAAAVYLLSLDTTHFIVIASQYRHSDCYTSYLNKKPDRRIISCCNSSSLFIISRHHTFYIYLYFQIIMQLKMLKLTMGLFDCSNINDAATTCRRKTFASPFSLLISI